MNSVGVGRQGSKPPFFPIFQAHNSPSFGARSNEWGAGTRRPTSALRRNGYLPSVFASARAKPNGRRADGGARHEALRL